MWGRRRIGKTRLLLEWCRESGGLYTVADQSAEAVQLEYFAEAITQAIPGFADVRYPNWRSLLAALARAARHQAWRGPLVMDELPYLVASSPSLPSVLQRWLDHEARDAGLIVALAGSAQHMMHGLVLDEASPLYGRASEAMKLGQLPVGYMGEALSLKDPLDVARAFAVWGGVPRYWELASPHGADLEAALDDLVLNPLGPLHMEPDRLLTTELPSAVSLRPLLDAIGSGANRVSEIGGRLGQPSTSLSRPLARLVDLGMVRRERPFGKSEKSSKKTLYKIEDPFLRTWFRVVAPRRAQLARMTAPARRRLWLKAKPALMAQAFEDLCRASVQSLGQASKYLRELDGFCAAGRFWERGGHEWDVVSTSDDGERLLLGEVKWREKDADTQLVEKTVAELRAKGRPSNKEWAGLEVVHVVFLPRLTAAAAKKRYGALVVQTKDILRVLK